MKQVLIGCSGWSYKDWRGGAFYPKGLPQRAWLEHYSQRFPTVEVNSTFYGLPSKKTTKSWAESTPDGFVFTVKASGYMTHRRRLRDLGSAPGYFYEAIEPLRAAGRLGPILWQLPPNLKRDDKLLAEALEAIPPGRHAFEFRDPGWFTRPVYDLLRAHGAALVIGDDPERPFQKRLLTADWTLIRFHRGSRGRRGNYSRPELDLWRRRIAAWRSRADVYAYFNNDWSAFAPRNAAYLQQHLTPG
jgi:uncharacterized protein YecE (DUF72 family)